MKKIAFLSMVSLFAVSLAACGSGGGSYESRGEDYCDCLISNGCWDFGGCPNSSDCYDIYATKGGSSTACFSAFSSCLANKCSKYSEFF